MQTPAERNETTPELMVQTEEGDVVKITGKPEVEAATGVYVGPAT